MLKYPHHIAHGSRHFNPHSPIRKQQCHPERHFMPPAWCFPVVVRIAVIYRFRARFLWFRRVLLMRYQDKFQPHPAGFSFRGVSRWSHIKQYRSHVDIESSREFVWAKLRACMKCLRSSILFLESIRTMPSVGYSTLYVLVKGGILLYTYSQNRSIENSWGKACAFHYFEKILGHVISSHRALVLTGRTQNRRSLACLWPLWREVKTVRSSNIFKRKRVS